MDFKNIGKLMQQAKKMQEQLKEKQAALAKQTVTGTAGGGVVSIVQTCRYQVLEVKLDPSFSGEDITIQQDLIKAAMNDATRKIEEALQSNMSEITSQLDVPKDLLPDGLGDV